MNISDHFTIKEFEKLMISLKERETQNLSLADILFQIEQEILNLYISNVPK